MSPWTQTGGPLPSGGERGVPDRGGAGGVDRAGEGAEAAAGLGVVGGERAAAEEAVRAGGGAAGGGDRLQRAQEPRERPRAKRGRSADRPAEAGSPGSQRWTDQGQG